LKIGRNEKCPCESGKKFKKCHMNTSMGKAIQGNYGQPYLDFIKREMCEENNNGTIKVK